MKAKIEKGLSWKEISAKESYIDLEEFEALKLSLASPEAEKWTEWGKKMRALNLGNHHLRSDGYAGKSPFGTRRMPRLRNLELRTYGIKSRTSKLGTLFGPATMKPGTGEFVIDYQDVLDFEKMLVRNLITMDISKSICVDFYMVSRLFSLSPGG